MFDTDGHASAIRKSICLSTSNPKMARKIPLLLKRFGIESRLSTQPTDGKGHPGPYFRVFITGEKNLSKFYSKIGFGHPQKMETLSHIIGLQENTNVDIIPGAGGLIAEVRKALGLTQRDLAIGAG